MQNILIVPHPILRQKAQEIKIITKEDLLLAEEMMEILITNYTFFMELLLTIINLSIISW